MTDLEKKWKAVLQRYGRNSAMYNLCWYIHCRVWDIVEEYEDGPTTTKIHFARRFK